MSYRYALSGVGKWHICYYQTGVTWPRWTFCSMLKIILVILIHIMSVVLPNILVFIVTLLILFTQEKRHIKISISCHVVPNWAIRQERAVWRHEYVRTQQQSEYDTHGEIRFTCTYTWGYSTIILTRMSYMINHRDEWADDWWLWKLHIYLPRWWWTKFNFGTKGLCGKIPIRDIWLEAEMFRKVKSLIIGLLQTRSSSKSPSIQFF